MVAEKQCFKVCAFDDILRPDRLPVTLFFENLSQQKIFFQNFFCGFFKWLMMELCGGGKIFITLVGVKMVIGVKLVRKCPGFLNQTNKIEIKSTFIK